MRNITAYTANLKEMKWNDFNFDPIAIDTLVKLENPEHYKNSFSFRDALLKAVQEFSNKEVYKLLVITPDNISTTNFYGIAFLEGKNILTLQIENTPIFKEWFDDIDLDKDDAGKTTPKIYSFAENLYSSQSTSNITEGLIYKDTGAFITQFIPNQFIAEKLAKEKADFLEPFIQLNANSNFEDISQNFKKLIDIKALNVFPPKNNEAIYHAFEKEANFPFPSLIKDYLSLHNGVENFPIMSAEKIVKEWKSWKNVYDNWTQDELLDTYSTNKGKTLLMYTTPYWIPFFDLENGNFLALDFAPNTMGVSGQVIRFGADQDIGYIEADSLNTFIKSLLGEQVEMEDENGLVITNRP
ncbi:SMI1/KNR4 family protein [Olleya sp. HaHaR_3_96]|uniref:SMI1/KNR4 family protein n=1 Tax=Olleya sp. HaHaR_3_96 TaxID=2745560 RepID=UPI001C4E504E|nr:SMI1/KNR4 family protein [Olleya sp. HaHaR_3_96]QXP59990.1 SMI1/KNR4 family protein [Olleya sp. HaHaR_3_96]